MTGKFTLYNNFRFELARATQKAFFHYPDAVLALSGGLDTRVLAGFLKGLPLQAFSIGSQLEKTIARKVAYTCSFYHKSVNSPIELSPYQPIIAGSCFDEVNGGLTGWLHPERFYEAVEHGLTLRLEQILDSPFQIIAPILEQGVLEALDKIPIQWRTGKQLQRWILKNFYPELWKIPYYNSLLPLSWPFTFHALSMLTIKPLKRRLLHGET